MFFTVAADYQLVIVDDELMGVIFFIFVHAFYILRAGVYEWKVAAAIVVGLVIVLLLPINNLIAAASMYAGMFIWDIKVNIKKPCHIITAGLLLFALCDICVLLYNLQFYFPAIKTISQTANAFIWWFYIPAQGLLAISALDNISFRLRLPHPFFNKAP